MSGGLTIPHTVLYKPHKVIGSYISQINLYTKVVSTSGSQPMSFYEEAGTGTIPAGEFSPLPEVDALQLPPSMRPFFRVIEHIKFFEGFFVGFFIAEVPSSSAISDVFSVVGDCTFWLR